MNSNAQKLLEIKAHPNYPFHGYAKQEVEHVMAELYWLYLFKDVLPESQLGEWEAWRPPDPARGGEPVFTALNRKLMRGIRIIQGSPQDPDVDRGKPYHSALPYLGVASADVRDPDDKVLQLCMWSDCSPEAEKVCRLFFEAFCVDRVTEETMAQMISDYEDEIGLPSWEDGNED